MNTFDPIIKWFDIHSGFATFTVSFVLVVITIYYAFQTRKQVEYAQKTFEDSDKHIKRIALNHIYLLNAEMSVHRQIFIIYSYCKLHHKNVEEDLDDIFKSLNDKKWGDLYPECAKCFSNKLMEGLTGYYHGVEILNVMKLNDSEKIDVINGQLFSMYKCIDIAESEFNVKLRKQDVYIIDGKKVSANKENGELIIK